MPCTGRRTAAPLGSRTVQENFNATVAVGARPRRRSLSLGVMRLWQWDDLMRCAV